MNILAKSFAFLTTLLLSSVALAQATNFVPLVPARLLDTRSGGTTIDGQFAGSGALAGGGSINLTILGRDGIPASGIAAVALNITVTGPAAAGYC